jgi:hypothetical protein
MTTTLPPVPSTTSTALVVTNPDGPAHLDPWPTPSLDDLSSGNKLVNWLKNEEPVLARNVILIAFLLLGQILVGHHIISKEHWSADTNTFAPIVTLVAGFLITYLQRRNAFAPATVAKMKAAYNAAAQNTIKLVQDNAATAIQAANVLHLSDGDHGRFFAVIDSVIKQATGAATGTDPATLTINPPAPETKAAFVPPTPGEPGPGPAPHNITTL